MSTHARDIRYHVTKVLRTKKQTKTVNDISPTCLSACGDKKIGHKGAWPRSRDLLLNFGTPLLSPVRMKLLTSNFAAGWRVGNAEQKNKKLGQKGHGLCHVTYF